MSMRRLPALLIASLLVGAPMGSVWSQDIGVVQSNILVLDTDRLFAQSDLGKSFLGQYRAEREALIAKNREVEASLREEEQALTEKRQSLSAEEFRALADAFDEKVRDIREQSEQASRDLELRREQAPFLMMRQIEGILFSIMRDAGGEIILDTRQVLARSDAIDITDLAIARVNEAMKEAGALQETLSEEEGFGTEAPEEGAPAENAPEE